MRIIKIADTVFELGFRTLLGIFLFVCLAVGVQAADATSDEAASRSNLEGGLDCGANRVAEAPIGSTSGTKMGDREGKNFSTHKPNYIMPITWAAEVEDRQDKEAKFQLSVKQKVFEYRNYELFLAYTQKSFWQVYDNDNSRPFRETNYNPEAFVRSPEYLTQWGRINGDLGIEHESNGQIEMFSRSWNKGYVILRYNYDFLFVDYKLWYRFPETEKKYPGDPEGDDNPDIHKYYGYSELTLNVVWKDIHLGVFGRGNAIENQGALRVDLSYPIAYLNMFLYLQYWKGYGESLIDYDTNLEKLGIGFMVAR
ncbi:MAG: phospholipase A [Proteobacteria bacterium]|nr:phospholipase A [Pseudomonadota bacterium]